jgi:hypothetical protein
LNSSPSPGKSFTPIWIPVAFPGKAVVGFEFPAIYQQKQHGELHSCPAYAKLERRFKLRRSFGKNLDADLRSRATAAKSRPRIWIPVRILTKAVRGLGFPTVFRNRRMDFAAIESLLI